MPIHKRECYAASHGRFDGRKAAAAQPLAPAPAREEPVRIRRQLVAEAYRNFGSRAAGRLWFKLGLPTVPETSYGQFGLTYTAIPTPPASSQGA